MLRVVASALAASIVLAGQDPGLGKLVDQASRIRQADLSETLQATASFKANLREWIEKRLPDSRAALLRDSPKLQPALKDELTRAELLWTGNSQPKPGYVDRVELSRPPADRNRLMIIAGVTVECGYSDSVYVYDYSGGSHRLVLESNGSRQHDESVLGVYSSTGDSAGSRLFVTLRYGVQCGSSWNMLAYDLYRLSGSSVKKIFAGEHEIWFGGGEPIVRLSPDDLRIELRDRSIDAAVHSRTHVLHYRVGLKEVERIDPVALQPQDFVDEWLTRPWAEMESRTAASARDRLKKSHGLLNAGDYAFVQKCSARAHDWQIAINMYATAGTPPSPTVYFLVRQLGRQRFEMMDVSSTRQQ
jgi:hypothetical protein